jgi:hypothetical protein
MEAKYHTIHDPYAKEGHISLTYTREGFRGDWEPGGEREKRKERDRERREKEKKRETMCGVWGMKCFLYEKNESNIIIQTSPGVKEKGDFHRKSKK